ncbi:XdhC family protein [Streptomyces aureus]|uniref:XdhC family protein n=1 Tax=Streptomyces aureus TaxID=193461 RepID=UPI00099E02BE|nr:XdhC/CoxI family protein [Streptomyces aureus]
MRDILPALRAWYAAGSPFGLATVVAVSRSAPRDPGAAMAVGPGDEVVGSVSGGCVEGAVFEVAKEVIASGEARLETFGYSDEDAFAVGLTCGGEITVLVRRVSPADDPTFGAVADSVTAGRPVTTATLVDGAAPRGATLAVWPLPGPDPGPATPGPGVQEAGIQEPGAEGPGAQGPDSQGPDPADPDRADPDRADQGLGARDLDAQEPRTPDSAAPDPADPGQGAQDLGAPGPVAPASDRRTGPPGGADPDHGIAGSLGRAGLDRVVAADVRAGAVPGGTGLRHYGPDGERCGNAVTVFVRSFAPPPRMLVFGAVDYAAAVARVGGFLGYRVTVCDARPAFATPRRFPSGVEVVVDWPHRYLSGQATDERTVICVLTHDPKFDVPVLEEALRRPAAYVGAMGSRRTHDDRLERLRAAGVPEPALARLRSPVGLDLGARTPEEVAVSVAAEIVALRRGGSGVPLTARTGAIHPR